MAMSSTVRGILRRAKRLRRRQRGKRRRRKTTEIISKVKSKLKERQAKVKAKRDTRRKTRPQREAQARAKRQRLATRIERSGRKASELSEKIRSKTPTSRIEKKVFPRISRSRRAAREVTRGTVTGLATETIRHPTKAVVSAGLGYATGGASKLISGTKAGIIGFRTVGAGLTGAYAYQKGKEIKEKPDYFSKGQVVGGTLATEIAPFSAGFPKGQRHFQQAVGLWRTKGRTELKGLTPIREEGTFPTAPAKEHYKIFKAGKHLREKAKPFIEKGKKPFSHVTGQEFKPKGELGKGIRGFKGFYTGVEPSSYFARISKGKYKTPSFLKTQITAEGTKPTVYIGQAKGFIKPKSKGVGEKIKEFERRPADKKGFLTEQTAEIEAVFKPQEYQTIKTKYYTRIDGVRVPVEKLKLKGKTTKINEVSAEFKPKGERATRGRRYRTRDRYSLTQESGLLYRRPSRTSGFDIPARPPTRYRPSGRGTPYQPPRKPPRQPPRQPPSQPPYQPPRQPPTYAPKLPARFGAKLFSTKKKKKFKQPTEYKPTVYSISRGFKATKSAIKSLTKGKRLTKSGLGIRPTQKGY